MRPRRYTGAYMRSDEERNATKPPAGFRQWAIIAATAAAAAPAPVLRLLEVPGIAHPDIPNVIEALIFGLGVFAAATLLTWASEVAETEVSAGLALVALALIAVLPEYAVDIYFAWTAPDTPENAHFAVANMTGGVDIDCNSGSTAINASATS